MSAKVVWALEAPVSAVLRRRTGLGLLDRGPAKKEALAILSPKLLGVI
jgi:hypothetical protein